MPQQALNPLIRKLETITSLSEDEKEQSSPCQLGWRTCGPMLTSFEREIDPHNAVCSSKASRVTRTRSASNGIRPAATDHHRD